MSDTDPFGCEAMAENMFGSAGPPRSRPIKGRPIPIAPDKEEIKLPSDEPSPEDK